MKIEVAKQISDLMLCYGKKLDESVIVVKGNCSEEEYLNYKKAVGKIMGYMLVDIMNKIYIEHPSLKPDELEL